MNSRYLKLYALEYTTTLADYFRINLILKIGQFNILEKHSDYWEMYFFYAYILYMFENADISIILAYLRDSLNAPKSIRVFKKEIVYNTFVAFSQKMNEDTRKRIF